MGCVLKICQMKLIVSLLLLVFLSKSRQFDANCMIRFYAVQQCQCPCWTFNGTNWDYRADAHRYSEEITTPSWRNFGFKCIRTFADDSKQCDKSWKVCLKNVKRKKRSVTKHSCSKALKFSSSTPEKYNDISVWKMGRHKMRSLRVRSLKETDNVYRNKVLGCSGKKCDDRNLG